MSYPVFHVPAGDTLPIFFSTYAGATGASITASGLAVTDIEIYKDGGTTQRASDAGYTLLDTDGLDFDAITGIHGFSINTGDNTDAGFYTVGAWFTVVVSAITVDTQTVSFIAAQFRLMAAENVAGVPAADTTHAAGTAWGSGAITAASLASDAGTELADAVHDEVVEGTTTLRQMMRGFAAVLMGKASGLATTTAVYRDVGDTKDRITATVDADGNRSVVTRDLT